MAALLVGMAVMAVMMTVALPAWRTVAQREKEEELIFRGKQYARAVTLFQRKFGNTYPANVDALVAGRFLRKKYKDPITGGDFLPLTGSAAAAQGERGGQPQVSVQGRSGPGAPQAPSAAPAGRGGALQPGQGSTPGVVGTPGGLIGVVSKSTNASIRVYNGQTHYNEWAFVAQVVTNRPGAPPGAQLPGGGRGGPAGVPPRGGPNGPPLSGGRVGPGGEGGSGSRGGPPMPTGPGPRR